MGIVSLFTKASLRSFHPLHQQHRGAWTFRLCTSVIPKAWNGWTHFSTDFCNRRPWVVRSAPTVLWGFPVYPETGHPNTWPATPRPAFWGTGTRPCSGYSRTEPDWTGPIQTEPDRHVVWGQGHTSPTVPSRLFASAFCPIVSGCDRKEAGMIVTSSVLDS